MEMILRPNKKKKDREDLHVLKLQNVNAINIILKNCVPRFEIDFLLLWSEP